MRCIASEGAVQSRAAEVSARDIQNSSDDRSDILNIVSAHAKLRRGLIDYFVNIALLDYITKLAISSAQFG
jgi:hypothetical protein